MQLTALFKFCRVLTGAILALGLFSCATQPTSFRSMSESELLTYNRGKPVMKQIHCQHNQHSTGSHIRRTECKSVENWVYHNFRTHMAIDIILTQKHSN
jgi:hypothetical protein